jgi:DNA-directed RNA polymerase specialized sigma24 family protein
MPFLRREWNITPELFEAFLAWLGPDRQEAGRKYEDIRRRLIKIFASRGCTCPEDLADETINRVMVRVPDIRADYRGDPARYFGGVARNVYHEYARNQCAPEADPRADPPEARERELECLDRCLEEIPGENRNLVFRYYAGEKGRSRIRSRNEMALAMGMGLNALRIRVHRIRAILQQCVRACLAQNAGG